MKKKANTLILLIILIVFLSGCWDATELDKLGISLIMGFDIENDKVLITAEVINPISSQDTASDGKNTSVKYTQGTGNNIFEAFRDITLKFDRRIFASHNKVIIFGEDFAKRGLVNHIDELFRDREQRETAYILIAKKAKAYEVMGINEGLEQIPSNYILELVKSIKNNPKTIDINFVEFLKHYYHQGHNPVTGIVEKVDKIKIDKTSEATGTQNYELSVIGSAVYKRDILMGYLNGNDTKALNFVLNNITGGIITFPTPISVVDSVGEAGHKLDNLSSVVIIKNKTKNDIEIVDGRVILKTKIKLRSSLGEVVGSIDISKEENIKKVEDACSKAIEEGIKAAIKKVQRDYKLDIFGFGLIFHRKYPKEWKDIEKDWNEIFSEADFQIEVDTHIIRTGLINTPINKVKVK